MLQCITMLQEIPSAFWKKHNSIMQEDLTLQGGDNECNLQMTLCNTRFYDH